MNIQQRPVGHKEMFYVEKDGAVIAELVYSRFVPGEMLIEHTQVDESLKGKGVGLQLIHAAVDLARSQQLKVIPQCPFALSVFQKKPQEFADVWKK